MFLEQRTPPFDRTLYNANDWVPLDLTFESLPGGVKQNVRGATSSRATKMTTRVGTYLPVDSARVAASECTDMDGDIGSKL